jgi:hypothetical protein
MLTSPETIEAIVMVGGGLLTVGTICIGGWVTVIHMSKDHILGKIKELEDADKVQWRRIDDLRSYTDDKVEKAMIELRRTMENLNAKMDRLIERRNGVDDRRSES